VTKRNTVFAIAYNTGAVALACADLMSPWLAAVIMPLSSLALVAATTRTLSPRSALWKS
jgi:cation transport ATPase